jgi:hypothetical protein
MYADSPYRFGGRVRGRSLGRPLLYKFTQMKKTNIYVDGFNLYYGALKATPYKWLNIHKLCQLLLPNNQIHQIKYFTALVSARPHDPGQPVRQQTYLRALETLPNVTIIKGSFLSHPVWLPLATPTPSGPKTAFVLRTEEKGSDVNLATHLINDGYKKMITNDSDLLEPMRIVRQELKLPVGIINPQKYPSWALRQHASFIKPVRPWALKASQFPNTLTDSAGTFTKPALW